MSVFFFGVCVVAGVCVCVCVRERVCVFVFLSCVCVFIRESVCVCPCGSALPLRLDHKCVPESLASQQHHQVLRQLQETI